MLRLLDRLEEVLIASLIAIATLLIFVSVTHRYSLGLLADGVSYFKGHGMAGLSATLKSAYFALRGVNLVWAQELTIILFVWMAKFGAAYGVLAMAAGFAGAVAGSAPVGDGSAIVSRGLWALLYIAVAANLGLGVGMIVRHSAGAISGLLMWSFVIETLFAPALPKGILHFLPFSAGYRLLDAFPNFKAPVVIAHELSRPGYAAIFAGYAVLTLVVGTALLYRRDSN